MTSNMDTIARDIIATTRRRITNKYPLLMGAVHQLQPKAVPPLPQPMATDGTYLFYSPELVCNLFRGNQNAPTYQLLHLCAHCLLGHLPLRSGRKETALFDALADVKAAGLIGALCVDLPHPVPSHEDSLVCEHAPLPLALRTLENHPRWARPYLREAADFFVDDHDFWRPPNGEERAAMEAMWGKIRERLVEEMEKTGKGHGDGGEAVLLDLQMACPNHRDYRAILKDFLKTSLTEELSLTDIDPMWYHFGLDYLGDIPIIEPAEESECLRHGTLVIAIDTSGSCNGEACNIFLRELSNLMESLDALGSLGRVVVLQCDWEIQDECIIADPQQWRAMADSFTPKGGGGTDFCPVFERAEELEDVVGLIYLTDADGEFPWFPPDFPTLLLLFDQYGSWDGLQNIPDWAKHCMLADVG